MGYYSSYPPGSNVTIRPKTVLHEEQFGLGRGIPGLWLNLSSAFLVYGAKWSHERGVWDNPSSVSNGAG